MLPYKYTPPEKMTTDYFWLEPIILDGSLWNSFIDGGRDIRMVAAKGANGLYAVRSGVIDSDYRNNRPNPFTFWTGLKDLFATATDYTKTFEEALTELRQFESDQKARKSGRHRERPDDAVHISKIPVLRPSSDSDNDVAQPNSVNPYGAISLPGNHNAM